MNARAAEGCQGALALVGITLGVIPLVRLLFTDEPGSLLSWIPGLDGADATVPVVVIVVAVVLIAVLERGKSS